MLSDQMSQAAPWEKPNKLSVIIIIHNCYSNKIKGSIRLWISIRLRIRKSQGWWVLHPEGWTSSLENAQKKLWGTRAVSRLQELGAHLASCGCPSRSCLCWSWDILQSTSAEQIAYSLRDRKTYPHCGWEGRKHDCWMLASGHCQGQHQSWNWGCRLS